MMAEMSFAVSNLTELRDIGRLSQKRALLDMGTNIQNQPILAHFEFGHGPEKVLMIHSWIDDSSSFDQVTSYLDQDKFTYVFADLRGYGSSISIEGDYTSTEAAMDVFRLADFLGWDRFHLMGHSMSGMISQRAALIDWTSGNCRIKSVVAITPVTANGYPADEDTKAFLKGSIHNREMGTQLVSGLTGGCGFRQSPDRISGNLRTQFSVIPGQ